MKHTKSLIPLVAGSWFAMAGTALAAPVEEAELILSRGEIRVPGGWAQALAVRRGVIVAVGEEVAVAAYQGAGTRVIDLAGATVIPGLHDMHIHPTGAGEWQNRCMFPQGSSAEVVQDAVKACVARKGKGAWITGGSWDTASLDRTPPHRRLLDQVAPDNPVILEDISGHSSLADSRALELARITRDTPDPAGGIIERDVIARGVFTCVSDLKRRLMRRIRSCNKAPRTVKWKYADPSRHISAQSAGTGH